jgi:signal transduction histidine kinase
MHSPTISRKVSKLSNTLFSANPLRSLSPYKIAEEKPDQFALALAHEIRNPLSNINLATDMLKSSLIADDQKMYADIITRASVRINDLVTDLLLYFQPGETQSEKYSIHQLLDDAIAITADRIALKKIAVKKYYTILDYKIFLDGRNMKIALSNILLNAIDAMSSENGELTLITKSINERCTIEIKDNGIGISKENLKNIFKPFYTNKPNGIGLGLSTTLNILYSNHFRVDVQSEEGIGTSFILSFNKAS